MIERSITTAFFQRACRYFEQLCDLPDEQTSARLAELHASEPDVVREVVRMLEADRGRSFLDHPLQIDVASLLDSTSSELPKNIGMFRVVGTLGAGSMGVVYEAQQDIPSRRVAIKALRGSPDHDSLYREVQAIGRLLHRAIPQVYELCIDQGTPYLVMERVEGVGLTLWAQGQTKRRRIEVMAEICDGIRAAHAEGVIHRDLKPSNILVTEAGQPKILDFGVASAGTTAAGLLAGTPAYMSPDALRGDPQANRPATDIYALGVLFVELLSGERPIVERTQCLVTLAQQRETGFELGRYHKHLDPEIEAIAARCLAADPDARYPDVAGLRDDLERYLHWLPISVRAPTFSYRLRCWVLRQRAAIIGAGLAGVVVATVIGVTYLWREREAERRVAEVEARAEQHRQRVGRHIEMLLAETSPDIASADAAFHTFAGMPEVAGTAALAQAWLDRAGRQQRLGRTREGLVALARAYVETQSPSLRERAGLEIAKLFARQWQWDRSLHVLENLEEADDLATRVARVEALVGLRMFGQAHAALASTADPRSPLFAALAQATRSEHQAYAAAFVTFNDTGYVLLADHRHRRLAAVSRASTLATAAVLQLDEGVHWGNDLPGILRPTAPAMLHITRDESRLVVSDLLLDGEQLVARERITDESVLVMDASLAAFGEEEVLFVGGGASDRGLLAWHSGERIRAHPATDHAGSDVSALLADDFDGDGVVELAASVGPWKAYDVRLFEWTGSGLKLSDRREVGTSETLASLPRPGKPPLLVVGKSDRFVKPGSRAARAGPAGVYLMDASTGQLEPQAFLALPEIADFRGEVEIVRIVVGDFDGDGASDLCVALRVPGSERAWFLRQQPDGSFSSFVVDGLVPLAAGQLDDDPADELIVRIPADSHHTWVLGAGSDALPPAPTYPHTPPAFFQELPDHSRRVETLLRLGLDEQASDLAEHLATSMEPEQATELLRWAAVLHTNRGALEEAERLYQLAIARATSSQVVPVLRDAALLQSDQIDLSSLVGTLAELRRHGEDAIANELVTGLGFSTDVQPIELHTREALNELWEIGAPESFLADDKRDAPLTIDLHASQGELLELPLQWEANVLALELDLESEHLEAGAELWIDLHPEGSEKSLSLVFDVTGEGGGDGSQAQRIVRCGTLFATHVRQGIRIDHRERIRLRVAYSAADHVVRCTGYAADGTALFARRDKLERPLTGERWRLRVRPSPIQRGVGTYARFRVHRLQLWGMRPHTGSPTPLQKGHRALVDHDVERAVLHYREASDTTYEFLALVESGEMRVALDLLKTRVPPGLPQPLISMHRFRPEVFTPLVREWSGESYPELLAENWGGTLLFTDSEPARRELFHPTMDAIEGTTFGRVKLLVWRGRMFEADGKLTRAHQEYLKVVQATARDADVDLLQLEARRALARLCAQAGAMEEARQWMRQAVANSPTPAMTKDRIFNR